MAHNIMIPIKTTERGNSYLSSPKVFFRYTNPSTSATKTSSLDSRTASQRIQSNLRVKSQSPLLHTSTRLHRSKMSGYYYPNGQRGYTQQHHEDQGYYQTHETTSYMAGNEIPYLDDSSQWAQAHSDQAGYEYFHPFTMAMAQPSVESMMPHPGYASSSSMAAGPSQYSYGNQSLAAPSSSSRKSRSPSPHPSDLHNYGTLNADQRTWSCAYPGCNSKAVFLRPCDLRKHFHRHSKNYFCRYEGCPQATSGGFSSRKDRIRHEAKHNPGIECEWEGCERIFSRMDNMKDHLKRIHYKSS